MKAVIMAGGMGTRLSSITKNVIPKPMTLLCGKPIIQWQIEQLKKNEIKEIIIVIGYLGHVIKEYFKDGLLFGVEIEYFEEEMPLGSGGSLAHIFSWLGTDDFFLCFGDVLFNIRISRMLEFHKKNEAEITLLSHPNDHPYDSDLIISNNEGLVTEFIKKNATKNFWYNNNVNSGIFILKSIVCQQLQINTKMDLVHDFLIPEIAKGKRIFSYKSTEYVKDIGTPSRLLEAENALRSKIIDRRNLDEKQVAIFFDRDGTINRYKGLIYKSEEIELEKDVVEALKIVNNSRYLAIIITNQPSVARGLCDIDEIENQHKKISTMLGQSGAYFDDIYYCPHHPDSGYPGENPKYKIDCSCRKPQLGLIDKATKDHNIDLKNSWIIGDTTIDVKTGENAGIKTVLLTTGLAGTDRKYNVKPTFISDSILDSVTKIMEEKDDGF